MHKVTFAFLGEHIASSRLRMKIPQDELAKQGIKPGYDVLVYGKHVVQEDTVRKFKKRVYDVCDDHFSDSLANYYLEHTEKADLVTCNSEAMKHIIQERTGRNAVVIPDPYESEEQPAGIKEGFFWFGHESNLNTITPYKDLGVDILTGDAWSRDRQIARLRDCAAVLLPTDNRQAKSANRILEAVRNGRFSICGNLPAYEEFKEWMWVGDIREGVEWFRTHKEEIKPRIRECQDYIRVKYSPSQIGWQWLKTLEKLS
jgi:hypothetical protein